jgi:hypothetical protein
MACGAGAMSAPRGRPFPPGNTQGRGRPKGSRNGAKSPAQELLNQYAVPVVGKCIKRAIEGDASAMRICMARIIPVPRNAFIRMRLSPINNAQDVEKTAEKVTQAIGLGGITPADGEKLMNVLEMRSGIMANAHFDRRLDKLEADKVAA